MADQNVGKSIERILTKLELGKSVTVNPENTWMLYGAHAIHRMDIGGADPIATYDTIVDVLTETAPMYREEIAFQLMGVDTPADVGPYLRAAVNIMAQNGVARQDAEHYVIGTFTSGQGIDLARGILRCAQFNAMDLIEIINSANEETYTDRLPSNENCVSLSDYKHLAAEVINDQPVIVQQPEYRARPEDAKDFYEQLATMALDRARDY